MGDHVRVKHVEGERQEAGLRAIQLARPAEDEKREQGRRRDGDPPGGGRRGKEVRQRARRQPERDLSRQGVGCAHRHLAVVEAVGVAYEDVVAVAQVMWLVPGEREMTQTEDGQGQEDQHEERHDHARVAAGGRRECGDPIKPEGDG